MAKVINHFYMSMRRLHGFNNAIEITFFGVYTILPVPFKFKSIKTLITHFTSYIQGKNSTFISAQDLLQRVFSFESGANIKRVRNPCENGGVPKGDAKMYNTISNIIIFGKNQGGSKCIMYNSEQLTIKLLDYLNQITSGTFFFNLKKISHF